MRVASNENAPDHTVDAVMSHDITKYWPSKHWTGLPNSGGRMKICVPAEIAIPARGKLQALAVARLTA